MNETPALANTRRGWEVSGASLPRLLLRVPEAAEALGISKSKAYELVAAGKLPAALGVTQTLQLEHEEVARNLNGLIEDSRKREAALMSGPQHTRVA